LNGTKPSALDEIEQYFPHLDQRNPEVSGWCVREQLHHALLSADGIARLVVESTAGARRPSLSPIKWIVLTTGKIPRGRAQAPKRVWPSAGVSREELEQLLAHARESVAAAEAADPAAWYDHFVFGVMRRNEAMKLIQIHTRHHLAIVKDILVHSTAKAEPRL
jgi:DinB superfamily